ncbi:MAG: histidine triad nucleotide-binding protein [Planctomycetaceae bacterium]|nr:histidine triad nucleotide-binding protein [Planctomycetaceae bacterium]
MTRILLNIAFYDQLAPWLVLLRNVGWRCDSSLRQAVTIFQKIINKEIPANIVYEDDLCLAFRDVNPQAPVHVLLIPKKPVNSLNELTPEDAALCGHLMLKVPQLAATLGLDGGYRTVVNTGVHGGQSVFHLHIHILGGRALAWPPG